MKAQLADAIRPGDWIYEIKFDGYRALALRGGRETRILSRNQKDLGKKFPEITSSIATLDVQDAILDGEIVALDDRGRPSFQLLQGYDMGLVRPPIVFYALCGIEAIKSTVRVAAFVQPAFWALCFIPSFVASKVPYTHEWKK